MKKILFATCSCAALMLAVPMLTGCATTNVAKPTTTQTAKKSCKLGCKKDCCEKKQVAKKTCCGGCKGAKKG